MANETRLTVNDRMGALVLIGHIVADFDIATRKRDDRRRSGAIGWVACSVFSALAEKPGAFVEPVPLDREELSICAGYTDQTVAKAMKRLVEQGLVTVSGSRSARMVQLHLPRHVTAAYQQHAARVANDCGDPFDDDEVDHALTLLDE